MSEPEPVPQTCHTDCGGQHNCMAGQDERCLAEDCWTNDTQECWDRMYQCYENSRKECMGLNHPSDAACCDCEYWGGWCCAECGDCGACWETSHAAGMATCGEGSDNYDCWDNHWQQEEQRCAPMCEACGNCHNNMHWFLNKDVSKKSAQLTLNKSESNAEQSGPCIGGGHRC